MATTNATTAHKTAACKGKFSYGGKVKKTNKVIMVCQKCGAIQYV